MAFKKGDPNINRKGRTSPNKATKEIKEAFAMLLSNNLDEMAVWLQNVADNDPKAAMELMIKLSERFVPKLSQQAITDAEGGDLFKSVSFNFGPPIDSNQRDQGETFHIDEI